MNILEDTDVKSVFLYKKSPDTRLEILHGADEGNRTLVSTLARSRSTIELHLHFLVPTIGLEPTTYSLRVNCSTG